MLYPSGTWSFCGQKLFSSWGKKPSSTSNQNQLAISSVVYMWATSVTPSVTVKSPGPLSVQQSNDSAGGQVTMPKLLVSVCGIPPDEASSCCFKRQANMPVRNHPTETTGHIRDGTLARVEGYRRLSLFGAALVKTNEFEDEQTRKTHTHTSTQANHSFVSS